MRVKLPAEQDDFLKRPAYIKTNDAGVSICENRCAEPNIFRLSPTHCFACCLFVADSNIWCRKGQSCVKGARLSFICIIVGVS